jgi:hypothetical protein
MLPSSSGRSQKSLRAPSSLGCMHLRKTWVRDILYWPHHQHLSDTCSSRFFLTRLRYGAHSQCPVLYTNKLYSKILHPVTDEDTMLQTSNTRSYTLSRSSNTRSYIILRASNTQSYITLRASNTQGYIILRISNTRSYTCHGRVTYEVTNFHRRITHDHTRVTQQVHRYYY